MEEVVSARGKEVMIRVGGNFSGRYAVHHVGNEKELFEETSRQLRVDLGPYLAVRLGETRAREKYTDISKRLGSL